MRYGTELFRTGKWVIRARQEGMSRIIHECEGKSTYKTISSVYHLPLMKKNKNKPWNCNVCKNRATEDIITIWIMLNWRHLEK